MAVIVLELVAAASSGIIYTAAQEGTEANRMMIHAIWGLGELLVSGQAPAELFTVAKAPPQTIIEKRSAVKPVNTCFASRAAVTTRISGCCEPRS